MGIFDIIKNAVNTVVDPLLFGDAIVYRKARVTNGRGGFTYVATQHACRALVVEYTTFQRSADGIPASHRQLLLAIDSLAVSFKSDDIIGFPDGSFWRPAADVGEPSYSILTIQVASSPAPVTGAVGTGAFSLGSFTFSGAAVAANLGAADVSIDEFIFLGEGDIDEEEVETLEGSGEFIYDFAFEGVGSLSSGGEGLFTYDFAFEGAGITAHLVTADITIDEFAFEGTGAMSSGGYGEFTYDFEFLGTVSTNLATASITIDEFTFDGDVTISNLATADITIDEFTFAASGYQIAQGSADLTYDFTLLGSGYGSNIGTGAFTVDEFTFSGAANAVHNATASITIDEFTFAGAATMAHNATASITISEFTFAGSASQPSAGIVMQSASWNEGLSTVAVPKPAGTTSGDLLLAVVHNFNNNGFSATPSGWTEFGSGYAGDDGTLHLFYKFAGGSEPSDYSWTRSGAGMIISMYRISGVNTTTPIQLKSGSTGTDLFRTHAGVTTTVDNAMVLWWSNAQVILNDEDTLTGFTASGDGSFGHSTDDGDAYINGLWRIYPTAGASGTLVIESDSSALYMTLAMVINPA